MLRKFVVLEDGVLVAALLRLLSGYFSSCCHWLLRVLSCRRTMLLVLLPLVAKVLVVPLVVVTKAYLWV